MDIQWDSQGSLMRVVQMNTAEDREELVARGTLRDLVARALAGDARDLLLRASGADWSCEYEGNEIRELATHPGFTGVAGDDDTAGLPRDQQPAERGPDDGVHSGQVGGPTGTHPTT